MKRRFNRSVSVATSRRRIFALGLMGFCASSLVAAMVPTRADRLNFGNEGVYPPFSMADSTKPQIGVEPDLARANAALPSMMADCAPTQIRKECIAFSLQPADAACADKQA